MARKKRLICAVALLALLILAGIGATAGDFWSIAVTANYPTGKPDGDGDYVLGLAKLGIANLQGYEPSRGSSD
jgi:hypothetical protein